MKRKGPDFIAAILITLILFLFIRYFIIQTYRIESNSMLPTLHPGDTVAGFGRFLSLGPGMRPLKDRIHRGNVIVFKPPVPGNEDYVKRVIALEGERISIRSDVVLINDRPLKEPYAFLAHQEPHWDGMEEVTVEPGHIFVMGDNRNHSSDSRSWGTVSISNVESRIFILLLPVPNLKFLP